MNDKGKIIIGLIIIALVGMMATPMVYNFGRHFILGSEYSPPELQKPAKATECVEDSVWMRENHMQLLDEWRDAVVREGKRDYVNKAGKTFNMSLQNECLGCHPSKEQFCDRCHDYIGVKPKCWACHIAPEQRQKIVKGEK